MLPPSRARQQLPALPGFIFQGLKSYILFLVVCSGPGPVSFHQLGTKGKPHGFDLHWYPVKGVSESELTRSGATSAILKV